MRGGLEIPRKYVEMGHAFYIDSSSDKEAIVGAFLMSTQNDDEESFMVGNISEKSKRMHEKNDQHSNVVASLWC